MNLNEWTQHYIKFKDNMKKQIISLNEEKDGFVVKEKKETKHYLVNETLLASLKKLKEEEEATFVVCTNTKKNIDELYTQWEKLIKYKQLTIIFANPLTNQSWLIKPKTHHFIAEKEKLKEGLESLSESIETY